MPLVKTFIAYRLDATKDFDRFANRRVRRSWQLMRVGTPLSQLPFSVRLFAMFCTLQAATDTFEAAKLGRQPAKAAANGRSVYLRLPKREARSKVTDFGRNVQAWLSSRNYSHNQNPFHARHVVVHGEDDDENVSDVVLQILSSRISRREKHLAKLIPPLLLG